MFFEFIDCMLISGGGMEGEARELDLHSLYGDCLLLHSFRWATVHIRPGPTPAAVAEVGDWLNNACILYLPPSFTAPELHTHTHPFTRYSFICSIVGPSSPVVSATDSYSCNTVVLLLLAVRCLLVCVCYSIGESGPCSSALLTFHLASMCACVWAIHFIHPWPTGRHWYWCAPLLLFSLTLHLM